MQCNFSNSTHQFMSWLELRMLIATIHRWTFRLYDFQCTQFFWTLNHDRPSCSFATRTIAIQMNSRFSIGTFPWPFHDLASTALQFANIYGFRSDLFWNTDFEVADIHVGTSFERNDLNCFRCTWTELNEGLSATKPSTYRNEHSEKYHHAKGEKNFNHTKFPV